MIATGEKCHLQKKIDSIVLNSEILQWSTFLKV